MFFPEIFDNAESLACNAELFAVSLDKRFVFTPKPEKVIRAIGYNVAQEQNPVREERIEISCRGKKADDNGDDRPFEGRERKKYPVTVRDNKSYKRGFHGDDALSLYSI